MIPTQPPKKKQKGVQKRVMTLRLPQDVDVYVSSLVQKGAFQTEAVIKCIRIARDAAEGMGNLWWEVERRANVGGTTPGAVLGQLALASMASEEASQRPKKP
jgi:hypothetical protein